MLYSQKVFGRRVNKKCLVSETFTEVRNVDDDDHHDDDSDDDDDDVIKKGAE